MACAASRVGFEYEANWRSSRRRSRRWSRRKWSICLVLLSVGEVAQVSKFDWRLNTVNFDYQTVNNIYTVFTKVE